MNFISRFITFVLLSIAVVSNAQPTPGVRLPSGIAGKDYNVRDSKGKQQGLWVRQWNDTHNVFSIGEFKDGIPQGEWKKFYPEGALMSVMHHVKDTTVVDVTMYHTDGITKISEGRFINRKKTGNWNLWSDTSVLLSEENYKDSLLDGECKYYYPEGPLLKIEQYARGIKSGPFVEYYANGKKRCEGTYAADSYEGKYTAWFDNGALESSGNYTKGIQSGTWHFFNTDGLPKVSILYENGVEKKRKYGNGTFKEYYENLIPKCEYSYESGQKNGPFTEWYDKGQFVQVPGSEEDKAIGIVYREQLQGTQIRSKGNYMDDNLEGEIIFYTLNGAIEKVEEWSGGKLIKTRKLSR